MSQLRLFFVGAATAASFVVTTPAFAGIDACGNIDVEANAECTVEVEGGCMAMCEPVRFEAACAGDLYVNCDGECNATAEASCTAACDVGACMASCDVDPPMFDCKAQCSLDAEAQCSASCEANANKSECEASCKATFSAKCEGGCDATPPSATCEAKCEARCEASCEAKANVNCQVSCQADGYLDCKADLEGGCTAECKKPEGALFCDGNYVDHNGNLEECIDALKAELNIEVDASATGNAECSGGSCTAEGEANASASCAVVPGTHSRGGAAAMLFGALGLFVARRRRR
ncbi:MAG: hypothetical protein R3A78_04760 [Polyangiales bacterium]|nr:hypothetical protein [Myxococcales bacterium]